MRGDASMEILHASGEIVKDPIIIRTRFTKDFSWGFYCTNNFEQAKKWALRKKPQPTINYFEYLKNDSLKILKFNDTNDEWLEFVANCRKGLEHDYDIVEGPMADDQLFFFVDDFLNNIIDRETFLKICKFRYPTHQISFHTVRALGCLKFMKSEVVIK